MRLLFASLIPRVASFAAFRSGEPWLDTHGRVIDAHGAGFLVDGGVTYWYGSQRNGWKCCHDGGINVYSSRDLYSWTLWPHDSVRHAGLSAISLHLQLPRARTR